MTSYPDYTARIDRLSEYMATKGVKYANHYLTIVSWAKKDAEKSKASSEPEPNWSPSMRGEK